MSWVRLWTDMPTDPKWRVIARRAGRPLSEVIAVFVFMMTNAGANATERGELFNWNDEDVAAALDTDAEHVTAIREAMQGKTLDGDKLSGWETRQPRREDNSAERARAWREKQKALEDEKNESERKRTQANAPERPDADTDADTDAEIEKKRALARSLADEFETQFWKRWPNKVGKPAAVKAFLAVRTKGNADLATILAGIDAYERSRGDKPWLNPATFLNQRRFEDAPAAQAKLAIVPRHDVDHSKDVWVPRGTDAERAWMGAMGSGYLAARKKDRPGFPDGGYWLPSEFPTKARA